MSQPPDGILIGSADRLCEHRSQGSQCFSMRKATHHERDQQARAYSKKNLIIHKFHGEHRVHTYTGVCASSEVQGQSPWSGS